MGIFDTLVIHPDLDVEGYPFNPAKNDRGDWRCWQTKQLNPSMDHYFVRPVESEHVTAELVRRSPPVTKWTTRNEGLVEPVGDIVEDADHWRQTRFSGSLELVDISEDYRTYTIIAEFENGFLIDIWLESYSHAVSNDIPDEYTDVDITLPDRASATTLDMEAASWYSTDRCPDCGSEFETWSEVESGGEELDCPDCGSAFLQGSVAFLKRRD